MGYNHNCLVCDLPHEYRAYNREPDTTIDYCSCGEKEGTVKILDHFIDLMGNKVEVGDMIATALTAGRSANLAIGIVERIMVRCDWNGHWQPRLRVIPIDRTYRGWGAEGDEVPLEERKKTTYQFFSRSVLLEKLSKG